MEFLLFAIDSYFVLFDYIPAAKSLKQYYYDNLGANIKFSEHLWQVILLQ